MFTVAELNPDGIDAFHVFPLPPLTALHDPSSINGIGVAAVINGAGPLPYASNRIGFPLTPLDGGINCSLHTPPRCR
jgi:hypothetical protein